MKVSEARRQLEKIQTLIENLTEEFPEEGPGPIATAFAELEVAGESIDEAIDLLSSHDDEDDEEEEEE